MGKMARSAGKAEKFCSELFERIVPLRDQELGRLRARKDANERKRKHAECAAGGAGELADVSGLEKIDFNAWDKDFYSDLLKREELCFDDEKVKNFFPLVSTIQNVLGVYSELLGLSFERCDSLPKWHEEV